MEEHQIPLFEELRKKRPSHGVKKRWRDGEMTNLLAMGVKDDWYIYSVRIEESGLLCVEKD